MFWDFSARSRVRGYLELYHAYVLEDSVPLPDVDNAREREVEPGWEMLDRTNLAVSTSQVCIFVP